MTTSHKEIKGFKGTLSDIELIDVTQMACLSGSSMIIKVEGKRQTGLLHILDGNIVHAQTNTKTGEEAFLEIMSWQGGKFITRKLDEMPPQTIKKNWEFLLIEATRVKDETRELEKASEEGKSKGIRVLIVDDSRFICGKMKEFLEKDPEITVVGTALNGKEALEMLEKLSPDLITLDINMPVMSGDTALKHIMIHAPCPVVIVSGIDAGNTSAVFDFLRLGAVDFISKPQNIRQLLDQQESFARKIKIAAKARVKNFRRARSVPHVADRKTLQHPVATPRERLAVLFGMAGGCSDILKILPSLPENLNAPVLVVQQIEKNFHGNFVQFLDSISRMPVVALENGVEKTLKKGKCYFALPGCKISVTQGNRLINIKKSHFSGSPFDGLEVLARSVFSSFKSPESIIWTFVSGEERAPDNLVEMLGTSGSVIVSQDPSTALHPELPGSYIEKGVADIVVPPEGIPGKLVKILRRFRIKEKKGVS